MGRPWWALAAGALAGLALLGVVFHSYLLSARRGHRSACEGLGPESSHGGKGRLVTVPLAELRIEKGGEVAVGRRRGLPQGKALVLNFWSATCPPCIEELPSMVEAARRSQATSLRFVFVNVDTDRKTVGKFWASHPALAPQGRALWLWDPGARWAASVGTTKYPETYLVGRNGRVLSKIVSSRDWMSLPARRCLSWLAAGRR